MDGRFSHLGPLRLGPPTGRSKALALRPSPIVVHHLLRHILVVADWRGASWTTIGAASTTAPARTIHIVRVVRARATSAITRNGLVNDFLLDFRVGLLGSLWLAGPMRR